ncbi:MAG: cytochrome c biogenesis protein CcsA [Neisseriaceae bacterium]|nr:cytochrome c biogenesis protein CcsA [Neisseriaceae bacterium]
MKQIILLILLFIYAGLGAYVWGFWRNRPTDHYPLRRELSILFPALLLHAVVIWSPILSFGHALNLITWLMLLMYCIGSCFYPLKGLQILLYPIASFSLLLSLLMPGQQYQYEISTLPMIHIIASIFSYCLFGISMLLAVLIILLERDLHRRKMSPLMRFLPPLLSLEKLMFQTIWVGFILLTISVLSGTVFSQQFFGYPFQVTHKSVFGIASWLIYAILLYGRIFRSWRGRQASWLVIIGFFSLMLAYIGSKFVLEIILGRASFPN